MQTHQLYNHAFGVLLLIISTCLAATINDYTTRESRQLIMVPKVTSLWFPLPAYNMIPDHISTSTSEVFTPTQSRLFGLTNLLAATRQCPNCPTCPATITCATCATCTKCPVTPILTGSNGLIEDCPVSPVTDPLGTVSITLVPGNKCSFTIVASSPNTNVRVSCPLITNIVVGARDSKGDIPDRTNTFGKPFESAGNSISLSFENPIDGPAGPTPFACTWQTFTV